MHLVFLGPPGAGKGTQASELASQRSWAHISTGDILRSQVKAGTELGLEAKRYMEAGKLIPDSLVCNMVNDRLKEDDCSKGWILDGFPRTRPQADELSGKLAESGQKLDACLYFGIDNDVLMARLTGRLTCRDCSRIYHETASPPQEKGICDHCGGEVYQRADDCAEAVATRLQEYENLTRELVELYDAQGLLRRINAEGSVEDVRARLEVELGDL